MNGPMIRVNLCLYVNGSRFCAYVVELELSFKKASWECEIGSSKNLLVIRSNNGNNGRIRHEIVVPESRVFGYL